VLWLCILEGDGLPACSLGRTETCLARGLHESHFCELVIEQRELNVVQR